MLSSSRLIGYRLCNRFTLTARHTASCTFLSPVPLSSFAGSRRRVATLLCRPRCFRSFSSYGGQRADGRRMQSVLARPWCTVVAAVLPFFSKKGPSRFTPTPILPSNTAVETSRIMLPDDTNPSGNVHGGTILKLIEQAGSIVATRHCNANSDSQDKLIAVLVRVEQMDFHQPMYVGEVSQVQAAVTFTSEHSIEVMVDVWADNVLTGQRRHTNSATLWYVAMPANLRDYQLVKPAVVPQLTDLTSEEYQRGKERYKAQKLARQEADNTRGRGGDRRKGFSKYQSFHSGQEHERHTVAASRSTLANVVLPSDCYLSGHMMGGSLMKMMDNAAGICAVSHCRTPVVTVCLEAINFHSPVMNGEAVFVTAELVFTSAKSMEIEIRAEAEGLRSGHRVTNTARFTFVSLGKDGHAVAVPPLKLMTDEEKEKFEEGKKRYEERKRLRLEKMNKNRQ